MDIIAAIDAATGCQQCSGPLGDSPSDDFCGQDCQEAWAAARTVPLVGYYEPWDLHLGHVPESYEGYRRRWMLGFDGAPDAPPVAVFVADPGTPFEHVPGDRWREVGTIDNDVVFTSTTPDSGSPIQDLYALYALLNGDGRELAAWQHRGLAALREPIEMSFEAVEVNWDLTRHYFGLCDPEEPREQAGPADPRERALWLRQHRNTGPARRQRPPRAITPRRNR